MIGLTKLLLTILINVICLQAQATIDEAQQALQELNLYILDVQSSILITLGDEQYALLRAELEAQKTQGLQLIDDQIANITNRILTMAETIFAATNRPVNECLLSSETDLQNFAEEWKNRVDECTGFMTTTGTYLVQIALKRMWYNYDINYECSQLIFNECQQLQGGECPDAVISAIENAEASVNRSIELFRAELSNQIIGTHFPCLDLVTPVLAVYPPLILDFAKSCFDQILASSYSFSC